MGVTFCLTRSRSRRWWIQVWGALRLTHLEMGLIEEDIFKIMSQNQLQAWKGVLEGEGLRGACVARVRNLSLLSSRFLGGYMSPAFEVQQCWAVPPENSPR